MHDILINWSPQETRVAIIENGAVQELHIERTLERGLVGNIYLGKVARVLPGMQSAFIDIGLERAAFLRDQIRSVERVIERQKIVAAKKDDEDAVAFHQQDGQCCVEVFLIRGGKQIGRAHV